MNATTVPTPTTEELTPIIRRMDPEQARLLSKWLMSITDARDKAKSLSYDLDELVWANKDKAISEFCVKLNDEDRGTLTRWLGELHDLGDELQWKADDYASTTENVDRLSTLSEDVWNNHQI